MPAGSSREVSRFAGVKTAASVKSPRENSVASGLALQWRLPMETLIKDIRYGVRSLAKRPGFTAIAVITLALGIGACTAIFSVVDGVLLRPLPYPEAERLVELQEVNAKGRPISFADPNFLDVRDRSRTLEGVAEYSGGIATVTGGSEPARAITYRVSGDFFRVLGTQPFLGRTFAKEESKPGGVPVAVIS